MKKQIIMLTTALMLTAGVACGTTTNQAQAASKKVAITKKNFPDQIFRELVKTNYDKNKDKKLSKKELKKATEFGTGNTKNYIKIKPSKYAKYTKKYIKSIKSFKGIEKLTYLKKFIADGTSVKTVNFKKNTALTLLQMTEGKLQKLDLNSNKKLKYVYLQYNQLTTLKMNKCKKLLKVNLTGHMVKTIQIDRNKSTEVIGEEYYAPYSETKVKTDFTSLNAGGTLDANGNYCVYEWSSDYSKCDKKTIINGIMTTATVSMDADAINKAKSMQKITAQWMDKSGNFYFIADPNGDMVAKTAAYLYKVNPQGVIEKEVEMNDWLVRPDSYGDRYSLYFMNQENQVVSLRLTSGTEIHSVVYFDMETLAVKRQVECNFLPVATEGDTVVGQYGYSEAIVGKSVEGKPTVASAKQTIDFSSISVYSAHRMSIPMRNGYSNCSMTVANNYVYLISGEGFYKAKLTADEFTQLYGIGKITGMQDSTVTYNMVMKSEQEIYMLFENKEDGKTTYSVSQCKIQ